MNINDKILITGGSGLVGTSLANELKKLGYLNVLAIGSKDCDLMDFEKTKKFFYEYQPVYVFHMAAAVFGIMGNMKQKGLSFLHNTLINTHVVEASRLVNVKKIVAMGSSASFPYPAPSLPYKEEHIWQGVPHSSEDSYGHSKRAMLAQLIAYQENYNLDYAFIISSNLYGQYDKFDIEFGHVIPSLVRKFYEAKTNGTPVSVWGDGSSCRDFLYGQDAARALIKIMESVSGAVSIGSGSVYSIKQIVEILAKHTGLNTEQIIWDSSKPNGQDYRAFDLSKLFDTGFTPLLSLEDGLANTYDWYADNCTTARK